MALFYVHQLNKQAGVVRDVAKRHDAFDVMLTREHSVNARMWVPFDQTCEIRSRKISSLKAMSSGAPLPKLR